MIASAGRAAETHDLSDDPRRMASAALMPLVEAIALLTGHIAVVPARAVSLSEAVGRIAGRDIISERDEPVRAIALRDGWAVRADDVLGASPYAPILLARALAWVESGAAMPEGTDAVVPPEALVGRTIIADASAREGTRSTGEEIAAGTCLVPAGRRITPLHCLALEAAGILEVPVRVPCVRLVVTGSNEPDSVSTLIANLAISEGAAITDRVAVAATPEAIAVALRAPGADATLILGGTGFGRGDQSADGLARAGSVHAHGIALRPGGTTAFGEVGGRPVLLLPGRPDAALSAFLTLGRPLLAALAGATASLPARAALSRKITSTIGLSEIVFARRQQDAILPLGGADLPLHRLIEADAVILVAAQTEGYPAGTPVEVLSL